MTRNQLASLVIALFLSATGCQQKMAQQPSYRPLEANSFFEDGRSARPLLPGTIARGHLRADQQRFIGKKGPGQAVADYVDVFPEPVTQSMLERGRQRYTIFCAVCHDPIGSGNGKIVERGYIKPPSFHTDRSVGFGIRGIKVSLRDVPVGYLYEVVSNGFGAMPDYASQIPSDDRWAIIAYLRTLQVSQNVSLNDLPTEVQKEARESLEGKP
ncbi:MAG: c-type cytochrome [Gemmataceae bacterium]